MTKKQRKLCEKLLLTFKIGSIHLFEMKNCERWKPLGFSEVVIRRPFFYGKVVGYHFTKFFPSLRVIPLGVKLPRIFPKNLMSKFFDDEWKNYLTEIDPLENIFSYTIDITINDLILLRFGEKKKDRLPHDKYGNILKEEGDL